MRMTKPKPVRSLDSVCRRLLYKIRQLTERGPSGPQRDSETDTRRSVTGSFVYFGKSLIRKNLKPTNCLLNSGFSPSRLESSMLVGTEWTICVCSSCPQFVGLLPYPFHTRPPKYTFTPTAFLTQSFASFSGFITRLKFLWDQMMKRTFVPYSHPSPMSWRVGLAVPGQVRSFMAFFRPLEKENVFQRKSRVRVVGLRREWGDFWALEHELIAPCWTALWTIKCIYIV